MARYTGPKGKVSRRYGMPIFGPMKVLETKAYPPGQHGPKGSRRKLSDYAIALAEKQKLRYQYGLLERQFRRYFETARTRRGITGEILLQLLETRLDNVVYRLGLSNTRRAARQFVGHGHISVNGRKVSIASYSVKVGDTIGVIDKSRSKQLGTHYAELTTVTPVPDWLSFDKTALSGVVNRFPTRDEIHAGVNEQLVVELYSR
jgi:small subunit ribosomal protein S4